MISHLPYRSSILVSFLNVFFLYRLEVDILQATWAPIMEVSTLDINLMIDIVKRVWITIGIVILFVKLF